MKKIFEKFGKIFVHKPVLQKPKTNKTVRTSLTQKWEVPEYKKGGKVKK